MNSENITERLTNLGARRRRVLMSGVLAVAWAALTVVLSAVGIVLATPAMAQTKPNIVFILADDLGWKDVGYHGSDIKTPNIDELAQTGARFEQFYASRYARPRARH